MKISELLLEKYVDSSWMSEITYNRKRKIAKWKTFSRGVERIYYIHGIGRAEVEKWWASESKGKYFHANIRDFYTIEPISVTPLKGK